MGLNTVNALLSRGIDLSLANILSTKGHTLSSLKQQPPTKLLALGLRQDQVDQLRSEQRPPIPEDVLLRVLHNNRRTCCVCREPSKSIVVHHIVDWAVSHSHAEENLAVLCLDHHDLAHTQKQLSQGLSKHELKASKRQWEKDVLLLDAKAILALKNTNEYARWDWINLQRLFELALGRKIRSRNTRLATYLRALSVIDDQGTLTARGKWKVGTGATYWYLDFGEGLYIASYLSDITDQLLQLLPLIDVTEYVRSRSRLRALLRSGDYIAAQLPFYFKDEEPFAPSKSQRRRAYYRGHSVRIEYVFDAWLCLSSSARFDAMTGHKVQTIFGLVRSVIEDDDVLHINLSCLAAGTAFAPHAGRGA